ncbi:DNA ligase D [Aestuariivirga sp.]|uniref:DNA ligase D n=1 Tax=Aestuariivirga sp. TaxID=2650926 RepID=UPI0039E6FE5D
MARRTDALEPYLQKRNFAKTPEPAPKPARANRQLVVQHHLAARDHYDLRLEINGVLASWAVTRGPSADPHDKRLAVRTEDHPLSYQSFEGVIPDGNYGAGVVQLWEYGTYVPLNGDPAEALRKGEIKFEARGQRMHGRWVLVRMKAEGKRENWLLIKERDEYAEGPSTLLARYPGSVSTNRTHAEIRTGAPGIPAIPKSADFSFPQFIAPQLCGTADTPPDGAGWLFEMKYDGYRLMLASADGAARLYTRSGLDWTAKFKPIADDAKLLSCSSCLIDGEAVVLDGKGISDFPALVAALEAGKAGNIIFMAFDVLMIDGADLRQLPLMERKKRLAGLVPAGKNGHIHLAGDWRGEGQAFFDKAVAAGAEGIIAKRGNSPYRSGRSGDWLKIKGDRRTDAIIIGYMPSDKHESFASLLAADESQGTLRYIGRVGTGYNQKTRALLAPLLKPARKTPPALRNSELLPSGAIFVKQPFAAEVGFGGWTQDRQLRQARFLGLQSDRPVPRVETHTMAKSSPKPKDEKNMDWSVTHPDRVLFPKDGITKNDIARYYEAQQARILPHLLNRPVSLLRAPDSIEKELFFQRHPLPGMKRGIVPVDAPPGEYFMLDGAEGLHTAVQFGAIEFHGWNATVPDLDHPDRVIFDLDPDEGLAFADVKSAALLLRDYLTAAGLKSWPMLSGGKGIHVIIPLDRKTNDDDVALFSSEMAKGIAREKPDLFVATMSKAKRKNRIFIDWLRNRSKSTAIVPWSLRARPGAPVATPVTWGTLSTYKKANALNIKTALEAKDWTDFFATPQSISSKLLAYLKKQAAR